jgi:hypothetical protein
MFTFPIPRRRNDGSTSRRQQGRRRPLVEDLEGRQLLSGIVADVQKVREAAAVAIKHEPAVPAIVGNHIGFQAVTIKHQPADQSMHGHGPGNQGRPEYGPGNQGRPV